MDTSGLLEIKTIVGILIVLLVGFVVGLWLQQQWGNSNTNDVGEALASEKKAGTFFHPFPRSVEDALRQMRDEDWQTNVIKRRAAAEAIIEEGTRVQNAFFWCNGQTILSSALTAEQKRQMVDTLAFQLEGDTGGVDGPTMLRQTTSLPSCLQRTPSVEQSCFKLTAYLPCLYRQIVLVQKPPQYQVWHVVGGCSSEVVAWSEEGQTNNSEWICQP